MTAIRENPVDTAGGGGGRGVLGPKIIVYEGCPPRLLGGAVPSRCSSQLARLNSGRRIPYYCSTLEAKNKTLSRVRFTGVSKNLHRGRTAGGGG